MNLSTTFFVALLAVRFIRGVTDSGSLVLEERGEGVWMAKVPEEVVGK